MNFAVNYLINEYVRNCIALRAMTFTGLPLKSVLMLSVQHLDS